METQRLKLLPPSLENQPLMLAAVIESQKNLAEFLPWVPHALTPEASMADTIEAMANFAKFEKELRFSIFIKATNQFAGAIGLIIRNKSVPAFEIGYWLRDSCIGQGIITEAITAIEQYAFTELKAKRLVIRMARENAKSRAVAERAGYEFEGTLRNERRLPNGELSDTLVFAKVGL